MSCLSIPTQEELANAPVISTHDLSEPSPQEYDCGCVTAAYVTDRDGLRGERPFEMRLAHACGKSGLACELAIFMVVRAGFKEPVTFGPFTYEEAEGYIESARESFKATGYIGEPGHIVNYPENRRSPCGPWLP